jgi:hypothetical protein
MGRPQLDASGEALLEVRLAGKTVPVGLCRNNALRRAGSPDLLEELLITRLDFELKHAKPMRASAEQIRNDWNLLGEVRFQSRAALNYGQ